MGISETWLTKNGLMVSNKEYDDTNRLNLKEVI